MSGRETTDPYPAFLGRGWAFPPAFAPDGSVAMSSGDVDIKQSLWILLSTSLGERLMLASSGCDLRARVFMPLATSTINEICVQVRNAIVEWEPRVVVESVTAAAPPETPGTLNICIAYTIRVTNTRSNLVYPFSTLEATIPPPPG